MGGDILIDLICLSAGASLPPPALYYLALLPSIENSPLILLVGSSQRLGVFLCGSCVDIKPWKEGLEVTFLLDLFKSRLPTEATTFS